MSSGFSIGGSGADRGMPWENTPTTISLGGSTYRFGSREEAWRHFNPSAAARWDAQNSPNARGTSSAYTSGGSSGGYSSGGGSGGAIVPALTAQQYRDIADPFHTQRGQYQAQLSSLVSDPSSFLNSSLAQAMNAQGIEAINRSAAAKKMLNSGNRLADLMKFGQGNAAGQYFNQAQLLGTLSGAAPGSPAAAAGSMVNAQSAANQYDINNRQLQQGQTVYNDQQNAADAARRAVENQQWQNAYSNLYGRMSVF